MLKSENKGGNKTLAERISESNSSDKVVDATLKTDERVIARVTDGIYRQPGSALRELISNAYDADASKVVLKTDAPRFERITVEDNGHGMTPNALAHMIEHIGGSAKRNKIGSELGVTGEDLTKSPSGRKLIGKIGIGLFSVAQLTRKFQVITKVEGDSFRTIATVALKQYSDDASLKSNNNDQEEEFESGKVKIWREKALDKGSHGTTIILDKIRPQARDTLRSREIWSVIEQNETLKKEKELQPERESTEEYQDIEPPLYHIGRVDKTGTLLKESSGQFLNLPWDAQDSPPEAFEKFVNSVWKIAADTTPNPRLDRIFDYYLRMVWHISLSLPLSYLDSHLFDLPAQGWARSFLLSNKAKGGAQELSINNSDLTLREVAGLETQDINQIDNFSVYFDDLKLSRPILYKGLPTTNNAIKYPLVFLGKCREEFSGVPYEFSSGPLDFEAYLFWNPKIVPVDHQGVLIRIFDASGTLFDSTFLKYQVAEQTRLRQITCEIFVTEGLDSALNIDRESFNTAHPHAVYITKWLHNAIRQLATTQKKVASEVRSVSRIAQKDAAFAGIKSIANEVWANEVADKASEPPGVSFHKESQNSFNLDEPVDYVFNISNQAINKRHLTTKAKTRNLVLEEKLKAITQILASFDILENLTKSKQEKMLQAIFRILEAPEE